MNRKGEECLNDNHGNGRYEYLPRTAEDNKRKDEQ